MNQLIVILKTALIGGPPPQFSHTPSVRSYSYVHWACHCFLKLHTEVTIPCAPALFWQTLQLLGTKESDQMFKLLTSKTKPPAAEICSTVAAFRDRHHGLYLSLHKEVENVLSQITGPQLFTYFGISALDLGDSFDPSLRHHFSDGIVNSSNFPDFWSMPGILLDPSAALVFQNLFFCKDGDFPKPATLLRGDYMCTLANQSICRQTHFFDILLRVCRHCLSDDPSKLRREPFLEYTSRFPGLRSLIILIESTPSADIILSPAEFCADAENPAIKNFIERVHNDRELFSAVQAVTGQWPRRDDFATKSLPKMFYGSLRSDLELLAPIRKKRFFAIDDDSASADFSFISAYKAMCWMLEAMTTGNGAAAQFSGHFRGISHDAVLNAAAISLFSLLFLQNGDGDFICSPQLAALVIQALLERIPGNKHFQMADRILTGALALNRKTLRECLIPVANCMIELVETGNYEQAKAMVTNNLPLTAIVFTAEAIAKLELNQPFLFPRVIDGELLAVEFYLCFNRDHPSRAKFASDQIARVEGRGRRIPFVQSTPRATETCHGVRCTRISSISSEFGMICLEFPTKARSARSSGRWSPGKTYAGKTLSGFLGRIPRHA
jgi:hypothetical protein